MAAKLASYQPYVSANLTAEEAERCDASYEEGGVNEHTCKPRTIRAHEATPLIHRPQRTRVGRGVRRQREAGSGASSNDRTLTLSPC